MEARMKRKVQTFLYATRPLRPGETQTQHHWARPPILRTRTCSKQTLLSSENWKFVMRDGSPVCPRKPTIATFLDERSWDRPNDRSDLRTLKSVGRLTSGGSHEGATRACWRHGEDADRMSVPQERGR